MKGIIGKIKFLCCIMLFFGGTNHTYVSAQDVNRVMDIPDYIIYRGK